MDIVRDLALFSSDTSLAGGAIHASVTVNMYNRWEWTRGYAVNDITDCTNLLQIRTLLSSYFRLPTLTLYTPRGLVA